MKKMLEKFLRVVLALAMVFSMVTLTHQDVHAEERTYTFEEITSEDQIILGMRYIITAEYSSEYETELGKEYVRILSSKATSYASYGYRDAYDVTKNDDGTITINDDSLYLKLRFEAYSEDQHRYRLGAGDGKYLYGFCYSSGNATAGKPCCSVMPIASNTYGASWWQFKVQQDGTWLITTQIERGGTKGFEVMTHRHGLSGLRGFTAVDVTGVGNVNDIPERETNIHVYREICAHYSEDVTHYTGVEASCTQVGTLDSYYCANCNTWATNNTFTNKVEYLDTFLPALDHNFVDGECTKCHTALTSDTYEMFDESYGSNLEGEKFVYVGKLDGKYYALGNKDLDGNRNAVEVTKDKYGRFVVTNEAEVFEFVWNGKSSDFTTDGGEFFGYKDRYVVMSKERQLTYSSSLNFDIPYDEEFGYVSYYDKNDSKTKYMALEVDGEGNPYFTITSDKDDNIAVNLCKATCKHTNLEKTPALDATCFEQGTKAHAYCPDCYNYFVDGNYDVPAYSEEELYYMADPFVLKAKGHEFKGGSCIRCGLLVPVYTKVTNQTQFEALDEDTYYIFAVEVDGKTYAFKLPDQSSNFVDEDGSGTADVFEKDENGNGVGDGYEVDTNDNGILDYEEDLDGDGVVDEWDLYYIEEAMVAYFYDYLQTHNTVEAKVNSDGTLSVLDKGALEFKMEKLEYGKIDNDRNYAFIIPNYQVSGRVPYYFRNILGLFDRGDPMIEEYGNWNVEFDDGEVTYDEYNDLTFSEGNTGASLTFGTGWGPSREDRIRLRVITNNTTGEKEFYFVHGSDYELFDEEAGELPKVPAGCTEEILPVYLYAYEAQYGAVHEHSYGSWTPSANGQHEKVCSCGDKEYADCTWDAGTVTLEPTEDAEGERTYTCSVCGNTKVEAIEKLPHTHNYGAWTSANDTQHVKECACGDKVYGNHTWDDGVVTLDPTEDTEGEKTYTCTDCFTTRKEAIEKLPHMHNYGASTPANATQHVKECACGEKVYEDCTWDAGTITLAPTEDAVGERTYTCTICGNTKAEIIDLLPHTHHYGEWYATINGQHVKTCPCGEGIYEDCIWDEGTVTLEPTEDMEGERVHTCTICGSTKVEALDKLPHTHNYGAFTPANDTQHVKECACGEKVYEDCTWDEGKFALNPETLEQTLRIYTCTVCENTKVYVLVPVAKLENTDAKVEITLAEGSTAVLDKDTKLIVSRVDNSVSAEAIDNIEDLVGRNAKPIRAFEISLESEGVKVQPGGEVEVTLPLPEGMDKYTSVGVVYIDDAGRVTPHKSRVNADNTITFTTDHFSCYAVVGIAKPTSTGDTMLTSVYASLAIASAFVLFVAYKKKEELN